MTAKQTSAKKIESIADLTPDPRNARKHGERNIGQIEHSLEQFGAARSIVVDENGLIIAGNGVVEAAASVGIEKVIPVEVTGNEIVAVVRKGLTPEQKTRLALADNRAGELSEWDAEVLRELSADVDLGEFFFEDELKKLMSDADEALSETPPVPEIKSQFMIVIECGSESEQAELLERFMQEGLKCRALVS